MICDKPGKDAVIHLVGMPGTKAGVTLRTAGRKFASAILDGVKVGELLADRAIAIEFPGTPLHHPYHRKLADMAACEIPADAEALYEATCFAASSDSLECQSLARSGPTRIVQVQRARDAYFSEPTLQARGAWEGFMFDGQAETSFKRDAAQAGSVLRVDFGQPSIFDTLVIMAGSDRKSNTPLSMPVDIRGEVSADLKSWTPLRFAVDRRTATAPWSARKPVRYFRMFNAPQGIAEVYATLGTQMLERARWRGSNMLASYSSLPAVAAWQGAFVLDEAVPGSYLAIGIHGARSGRRLRRAARRRQTPGLPHAGGHYPARSACKCVPRPAAPTSCR